MCHDREVMSHFDIANTLAYNLSRNSSSAFSTDVFAFVCKTAEKQILNLGT